MNYSEEVKQLCSIDDRFYNEPIDVQDIRTKYADIFTILTQARDNTGRSEAWRNYSIAITELENSCIRAIKALYSK